jgi:hypothetical protein
MQEQHLQELRRGKWRLDGNPIRTLDDARAFIDSVGFCLLYPQRPAVLAPTFVGAYAGSDQNLPTAQKAFANPQAREAKQLMVRLLRDKAAYEARVFADNNFLVSASVFPYFYGLVGDRNPRQPPKSGARSGYSQLACDAFPIIQKEVPIAEGRLRQALGKSISQAALDHALDELWGRLRITRVDYKQDEGVFWDALFRWSPEAVRQGMHVSVAEALTALVSKYLDCVLAATQEDVENFFSPLVGRARVREAIHALQAAREISFVHVGGRVMMQVSSLDAPAPYVARKAAPQPRFEPLPPRPGKPLVQRQPRRNVTPAKSADPGKSTPPKKDSPEE